MGVDINVYRAAIGRFSNASMNLVKIKREPGKSDKLKPFKWNKFLLLLCLLISAATFVKNTQKLDAPSACISVRHISGQKSLSVNFNGAIKYDFTHLNNKYSKRTNGNRNKNGIRICHFNKGNSILQNRISEVETMECYDFNVAELLMHLGSTIFR